MGSCKLSEPAASRKLPPTDRHEQQRGSAVGERQSLSPPGGRPSLRLLHSERVGELRLFARVERLVLTNTKYRK